MKKRFIAGAVCPKCQAQDRIMMFSTDGDEWIECIECHYSEKRPTEENYQETAIDEQVTIVQLRKS